MRQQLRVAMVGISPADQITIKGYLRVLLRLDVSLEWVSAGDNEVHLFFVNEQFKNASSVNKALQSNIDAVVLYVNHSMGYEGGLVGNLIGLPLKNIELLEYWLRSNLGILANPSHSFDDIDAVDLSKVAKPAPAPAPSTTASTQSSSHLGNLVTILKALNARQGLIALTQNGAPAAIIDPKRQRVWVQAGRIALDQLTLGQASAMPTGAGEDAVSWLYDLAITQGRAAELYRLVDEGEFYLRYWVRPSNSAELRDAVAVMTALERKHRSAYDVARITGIARARVEDVLAALLMCGAFESVIYEKLVAPVPAAPAPVVPIRTPPPAPTPVQTPPVNKEKMGFLARLRRKLGL